MPHEIGTARLTLQPWQPEELDALHRIWCEPDVRRFLFDDREVTRAEAGGV